MPGSGWCHHPQRKVSSDVKILVRRSELACRDDWSRSLWQPATGEPAADAGSMRATTSGPLLPASPESLRAILNRDLASAASAGEDVLLSEGRIVTESQEPWEPPSRRFPAGNFDPRTAIFKAREAYREKIRANALAARQSTAESGVGAFERAPENVLEPDADDAQRFDSMSAEVPSTARTEEAPLEPAMARSPEGALAANESSSAADLVQEHEQADEAAFWSFAATATSDATYSESGSEDEVCAPELPASLNHSSLARDPQRSMLAAELPGWFRADLPRVCRACRDFRPGTDGQRGWCANAWAFTHRQLVQEDDVAPCHSAIGDWWAPVDDVWLVAADVSSHGRATPLLDRTIGVESGKRRRS